MTTTDIDELDSAALAARLREQMSELVDLARQCDEVANGETGSDALVWRQHAQMGRDYADKCAASAVALEVALEAVTP